VAVVWLIVIANYSHEAIHVVGLVLGLQAIVVLLVIAFRLYKNSK
jgi:hypothetical protein